VAASSAEARPHNAGSAENSTIVTDAKEAKVVNGETLLSTNDLGQLAADEATSSSVGVSKEGAVNAVRNEAIIVDVAKAVSTINGNVEGVAVKADSRNAEGSVNTNGREVNGISSLDRSSKGVYYASMLPTFMGSVVESIMAIVAPILKLVTKLVKSIRSTGSNLTQQKNNLKAPCSARNVRFAVSAHHQGRSPGSRGR
jgi:hypothetical protein